MDCTVTGCVSAQPFDDYGHGTHVGGLIAGTGTGVAPGALLVGLKVLDENGQGRTSDVLNALDWVRRNKELYGIQVVNLSLGHPIYEKAETDPLVLSVQETARLGVKVLVAAGNFGINPETGQSGYAGITSPGNAPNAITVGAVQTFGTVSRADDRVAPYSSRGPTWYDGFLKPDLVAPGDGLEAPMPSASKLMRLLDELDGNNGGNLRRYARLSGTSMATGVASGVVAAMLQASAGVSNADAVWASGHRGLTYAPSALSANAVKAILQYTAIPVRQADGTLYDPLTQGSGDINAGGAVSVAANIDPMRDAPEYWLTGWNASDEFGQTTIGNTAYAWTQNIFWGDNIVWGSGLVTNAHYGWGDNIVWGSLSFADNIVWGSGWGDNIVWGSLFQLDNIVWGSHLDLDNIVWGSSFGFDNIVWGSDWGDNIVWGSAHEWLDNIVWGSTFIQFDFGADNIVWGSDFGLDNIVWGSDFGLDNIVWSSDFGLDNIVWGSLFQDNVVWGSNGSFTAGREQGE
jgi:serine protease AprX